MDWKAVNFDWNRARAFLVTAEEGSLSAAARALETTQPTLSRQVSALETELGVALFERVGQGLALTQAGVQLLEHVRRMGESAMAFSVTARGQSQELRGSVVISASEVDAYFRLPPILAKLRQLEPGIQIEVVVSNEASDLKRREADIALRSFRPNQPDLIARRLRDERIWLFGASAYLASLNGREPKDISTIQVLSGGHEHQVVELLSGQGWTRDQINFSLQSRSISMQLALMHQGLGMCFLPEDIGKTFDGVDIAFPQLGPILDLSLWLVCHRELRTSARVRRVFDLLATELAVH